MEDTRKEKFDELDGQFILTGSDIAELMSEEENDMENTKDESKKAIIKERLEKYEKILAYLDEVTGLLAELKDED